MRISPVLWLRRNRRSSWRGAGRFQFQGLDEIGDGRGKPVCRPDMFEDDHSLLIDYKRRRDAVSVKDLGQVSSVQREQGSAGIERRLVLENFVRWFLAYAHDQDVWRTRIMRGQLAEAWQFHHARRTPGRPDIQHNDSTAVIFKLQASVLFANCDELERSRLWGEKFRRRKMRSEFALHRFQPKEVGGQEECDQADQAGRKTCGKNQP